MADATRQLGRELSEIRPDHVKRYYFAASRIGAGACVLDAACGIGYGSKILADSGLKVLGVDISESAIVAAEKYYPGPTYICSSLEKRKFGRFDVMVSFETLEHVKDPDSVLQCADCSVVIASVPNEEYYKFDPERFKDDDYPHLRHYRPDEFSDLITRNGFLVAEKWCQRDKGGAIWMGTKGIFLIYVAVRQR